MRFLFLPLVIGTLVGCAAGPMSLEQREALMRSLDNMRTPPSTYQIVQPQPVPVYQAPRSLAPISCRTYRNLGGQIQTDCN